jgi:hypothetical protein
MARCPRDLKIETRTARIALKARGKPYGGVNVAPGLRLYYRRNKTTAGTFVGEAADGNGGEWQFRVGVADDHEDADGEHVLTYWQAIERARAISRGTDTSKPATVATALEDYAADLRARDANPENASHIRYHLPAALLNKPVALITAAQLRKWRNGLIADGIKPHMLSIRISGCSSRCSPSPAHAPRKPSACWSLIRKAVNRSVTASCADRSANSSASIFGRRQRSRLTSTRPTVGAQGAVICPQWIN